MTILFLDTEFTDLLSPELLSIGMVTRDGQEFYAELDLKSEVGLRRAMIASEFVKYGGVLDQWGRIHGADGTEWEMGRRAAEWLLVLAKSSALPIEIAVDYSMDYELLEYAIRDAGLWDQVREVVLPINIVNLTGSPGGEMAAEACYRSLSKRGGRGIGRHHALADALALRAAYLTIKKGVIEHATPAGANIFSELGFGPREASDLLEASNQAFAAKLAAPIADPDGSSVHETEAEYLTRRNNVSDAELAARVQSAPDMGGSMLVELSTFVQERAYRFKRYQDSDLLARGSNLNDMTNLAASGFGREGHYGLLHFGGLPKEGDIVELIAASPAGQPIGMHGVVVHVYPNGEAFEVEFHNAAGYSVETVPSDACRTAILVNDLLKRWAPALSQKLGRSEESIMKDGLVATDFPSTAVRIVFEDGSNLHFENAFFVGDVANRTKEKTICRVAVFTEHNGYHEFWVGPEDRIDVVDGGSQIVLTDRESLRLMELMENPPPYNKEFLLARAANFAKRLKEFRPEVHSGEFPQGAVSHEAATIQEFQADPQEAADYLGSVTGDGDPDEVVLALRRISAAFGSKDEVELNRDFKQTVAARVERDPAFAIALLDEAKALFLSGESTVARGVLIAMFATTA